tara:strand:+ start:66 stop:512 length:447 start_codon:yes stop_codon:yes gene_type:complete
MNVDPSTLDMDEINIDPTQAKALWEALFAITKAVEQLGLGEHVNGFRHVETDVGAFDFANAAIKNAVIDDDDCVGGEDIQYPWGDEEPREIEAAVNRAYDRLADQLGYTAEDIASIKAKFERKLPNRQPSDAEEAPAAIDNAVIEGEE